MWFKNEITNLGTKGSSGHPVLKKFSITKYSSKSKQNDRRALTGGFAIQEEQTNEHWCLLVEKWL